MTIEHAEEIFHQGGEGDLYDLDVDNVAWQPPMREASYRIVGLGLGLGAMGGGNGRCLSVRREVNLVDTTNRQ